MPYRLIGKLAWPALGRHSRDPGSPPFRLPTYPNLGPGTYSCMRLCATPTSPSRTRE
jgi:hypothetical protein